MKQTFRLTVKLAGASAALLLMLSVGSMYISPAHVPYAVYASLMFVPLIAVNLFFFVFYLVRIGRISAAISAIALVCAMLVFPRLWQWPFKQAETPSGVKVMSYNVHLFDAYDWRNPGVVRNEMYKFLQTEQPDIFTFQEFYYDATGIFQTRDTLQAMFNMPYCAEHYSDTVKGLYFFGIATVSRYPIVNREVTTFPGTQNLFIATDIALPWDTVRFINCHLQSIRFSADDYRTINDHRGAMDNLRKIRSVLGKVHRAGAKRALQAEELVRYALNSPHPVVVCGDFNDPPLSYTYQHIRNGLSLTDAFMESGSGFGGTYNGPLPSYRIDYILHSDSIASSNFEVHRIPYSDHFPVSCYLRKAE